MHWWVICLTTDNGSVAVQNSQYLCHQGGNECRDQERDRFSGRINAAVIVAFLAEADFNILPGLMTPAPGQNLAQGCHQHFQKGHREYSGMAEGHPVDAPVSEFAKPGLSPGRGVRGRLKRLTNNPVFRQRLWHIVNAVRDIEHTEHHGVERVHFQVKVKGVERVVTQRGSGLKGPDDIHHGAGKGQQTAQCQQGIADRVIAHHIRRGSGGHLSSDTKADGQPDDKHIAVNRHAGGVTDNILFFI